MARDENIPIKESAIGGVPVTDVASAQRALKESSLLGASEKPSEEDEDKTEAQESASEQDMKSESVETEASNPDGLTADDLEIEDTEEEPEEQERYTVKAAGKEHSVTLDELKKGFQFGADYSRDKAILAEDRKKLEAEQSLLAKELETTQQEKKRYLSRLEDLDTIVTSDLKKYDDIDWPKLKEEDPVQYALKKDEQRDLQMNQKQIADEKNAQALQAQSDAIAQLQKIKIEQNEVLNKDIPNWNHPVEGPKIKTKIKNYAMSIGFTEQELSQLVDARSVKALNNAMKYEELVNAKIKSKKVKNVPKVTKPGTKQTADEVSSEKRAQLRNRLKKTGRVEDAQNLIKNLL
tara:strand:- start:209 stop:1258 length:1050 start_codon:yes stop_codon:yes gene_type:complete